MLRHGLIVLVIGGLATAPALAAPFCTDSRSGVSVTFGFSIGDEDIFSESDQNSIDLARLQRRGVETSRVERWNGCLRAFVRQPGGGEIMQFFDPDTLEQVW